MNVMLLVPPTAHPSRWNQPPIGALFTAAVLKERGHAVRLFDLRLPCREEQWVQGALQSDVVILETTEYDMAQCYTWELDPARDTVLKLRANGISAMIAAVGSHTKTAPELTTKFLDVDAVLIGENEHVVPAFLEHLTIGQKAPTPFVFSDKTPVDVASLPLPDYSLLDLTPYKTFVPHGNGKLELTTTALILANRGCPFACDYCYIDYFGTKMRLRPVEKVIAEVKALYDKGIRNFFFLDYTFTVRKDWVLNLTAALRQENLPITWGCQTRCDTVSQSLLDAMREAGCRYIWYGIESPDISSQAVNKNLNREKMSAALRWTVLSGIQPMAFLLVGFPVEDIDSVAEWVKAQPFIFVLSTVLPRPGTPLFARLELETTEFDDWRALARTASFMLQPDRQQVRANYQAMTQLENYFDNRLT